MRIIKQALGGLTVLGLVVVPATAQQPGQMGGMQGEMAHMQEHMGAMMGIHAYAPDKLLEKKADLALTPDQVAKLEALQKEIVDAKAKSKAQHDVQHEQVVTLFSGARPDPSKVAAAARGAMGAMAEGHGAELAAVAKAKGLLTDEQRQKVAAWTEHEKHQMGGAKHDKH